MGTNCAPLVADLFLFCYTGDLIMSFSDDKLVDIIDTFKLLREISCKEFSIQIAGGHCAQRFRPIFAIVEKRSMG